MKNIFEMVCIVLGGALGFFLAGFNGFVYVLVGFMSADYITGVLAAIVKGELSSEVGFHGITKKVFTLGFVGIACMYDTVLFGCGSVFMTAVTFFYLAYEVVSVIENMSFLGVPFPKKLMSFLGKLKSEVS